MSIKKVANIAGVSIATVSRFFNNPNQLSTRTREKVQAAIKQINYSPNTLAQNLRRGKTGLLIAVVPQISAPVYESILKQLHRTAKTKGYTLLVKQADLNSLPLAYYQQMVRCKQADGFILLTGLPNQDLPQNFQLPLVLACEPSISSNRNLVNLTINYQAAAQEAVNYLIHLGHREIAFTASNNQGGTIKALLHGFEQALLAASLSPSHIAIHNNPAEQYPETLQQLLATSHPPTALFCADDDTALRTLQWVKSLGIRVPEDLSVIGFNDNRYLELTDPPLTTVSQPMDAIGAYAVDLLCDMIDGKRIGVVPPAFKHTLIIRNSTARILS